MILSFFSILLTVFIAEMGDKTQLLLVALSSRYKLRDIVAGTAAAILVLNALAVALGSVAGNLIPLWIVKLTAGLVFLLFALSSFKEDDDEEEESGVKKSGLAIAAVFFSFFIAEFGDKTQLAAFTFGASEGLSVCIPVWLACSAGLFLADMLGLALCIFLKKKVSLFFIHVLAALLFAFFGFNSLYRGLVLCPYGLPVWKILAAAVIVFVLLFAVSVFRRKSCR
ncbi:TMEM165/GDT1 family protein [Treponema sp.]|uniref:TMEM165/GDT1 family protein n=1 Tax=Treponema sp. TaxID=166 RepID=UPI0025E09E32|nr:TMEM165/GDT1 family protein [Treponema sp.]MCR5217837.1 TMEM165/GDT1 family protein [Treponema sp.]